MPDLPDLVTHLTGDITDLVGKMEEARAEAKKFADEYWKTHLGADSSVAQDVAKALAEGKAEAAKGISIPIKGDVDRAGLADAQKMLQSLLAARDAAGAPEDNIDWAQNFGQAAEQAATDVDNLTKQLDDNRQAMQDGDGSAGEFRDTLKDLDATAQDIADNNPFFSLTGRQLGLERTAASMQKLVDTMAPAAAPQTFAQWSDRVNSLASDLNDLQEQRVNVTVDDAEAEAKMAPLKAELAELTRTKRIPIDADIAQALAKIETLKAAEEDAGAGGAGAGGGGGFTLGGLGGAAGGAALGGLALGLAPALIASIAPLGAGLLTAGFTGYSALSGVPAAIQAQSQAQATSGQTRLQAQLQTLQANQQVVQSNQQVAQSYTAYQQAAQQAQFTVAQAAQQAANAQVTGNYQVMQAQEALRNATVTANYQVLQSEQAVATARLNAANSLRTADQAIVPAEEQLTNSIFNEQQAQIALTNARQAAQFQLQDYTNQLKDAALAQQGAYLQAKQAAITLQQTLATPGATQLQREEAMLAYQQAIQGIQDQKTSYQQLQTTASEAQKQGVNGNTAVVQALHAVKTAQQAVQQAVISLADARINKSQAERQAILSIRQAVDALRQAEYQRSQSEQQAEQSLRQAIYQRQEAEKQAAETLKEAQITTTQQVAAAKQAWQNAVASAAEAQKVLALTDKQLQGSTASLQQAMQALAPAARDFVRIFEGSPLGDLGAQLQQIFFRTLLQPRGKSPLDDILKVMKELEPVFLQAAGPQGIGGFISRLASLAASPAGLKEIKTVFQDGNKIFDAMGDTLTLFITTIGKMSPEVTPVLVDFFKGLDTMISIMGRWAQSPAGKDYFQQLGKTIQQLAPAMSQLLLAFYQLLPTFLQALPSILSFLTQILQLINAIIKSLQQWFGPGAGGLMGALIVGGGILGSWKLLQGAVGKVGDALKTAAGDGAKIGEGLKFVAKDSANAMKAMADDAGRASKTILQDFGNVFGRVAGEGESLISRLWGGVKGIFKRGGEGGIGEGAVQPSISTNPNAYLPPGAVTNLTRAQFAALIALEKEHKLHGDHEQVMKEINAYLREEHRHHGHHPPRKAIDHMDVAHLHVGEAHMAPAAAVTGGGFNATVHIHITGPLDIHDKAFVNEIGREVREELIRIGKRNGSVLGGYAGVRTGRTRGA